VKKLKRGQARTVGKIEIQQHGIVSARLQSLFSRVQRVGPVEAISRIDLSQAGSYQVSLSFIVFE
jgi:hypothetical protein